MRDNQPVTQREYLLPAGKTLVSVTDDKGRITYCNAAFVEVSGYSEDELLGQPHNIVRHPDMPAEAFRDLWATVDAGQLWSALVKNRRKSGDHYWVKARVTPVYEGSRIVGHMSIRTQPTRDEIAQAEQLYARLRADAAQHRTSLGLQQGKLVYRGLRRWLQIAMHPTTRVQFLYVDGILLALMALAARQLPWPSLLLLVPLGAWLMGKHNTLIIVKPLQGLLNEARLMAAGDLSSTALVSRPGVIGQLQQAMGQLAVNLRTVVQDVRIESENLRHALDEIASGNRDLSARTESAASSLEQTAASMEELSGTVRHSAKAAQTGAQESRHTAEIARRSHEAVQAVADTMDEITESSSRIGEITQLIEGVAFQTNILALNAAVEAARAGEAGRGFGVVAAEVRALSLRTSQAASEIKHLIAESSTRVAAGSGRTREARERMQEALGAVRGVATVLDEISLSSTEQLQGITQVSEVISHLDTVTQQNAAMVEELAGTASLLHDKSDALGQSMRLFRLRPDETTLAQIDAVQLREQRARRNAAG